MRLTREIKDKPSLHLVYKNPPFLLDGGFYAFIPQSYTFTFYVIGSGMGFCAHISQQDRNAVFFNGGLFLLFFLFILLRTCSFFFFFSFENIKGFSLK